MADYYKVTALFANGGTPHVQTLDMVRGVSTLPPVVFHGAPLGGKVNVSVGFYSRSADPSQNDWLAGKGTSGLVDNSIGQVPEITIEQFQVPIQSNTVYARVQKTALDANGHHRWVAGPAPPSTPIGASRKGHQSGEEISHNEQKSMLHRADASHLPISGSGPARRSVHTCRALASNADDRISPRHR